MQTGNIFADALPPVDGERFERILKHRNLVVERIVSSAAMVPGEYVQPQDEWVVLVQGEATLQVAGETMALKAGDHLFLPAGVPHSVQRVSEGAIWLAVHLYPEERGEAAYIERQGDVVVLRPKRQGGESFFASATSVPDDFLADRIDLPLQERKLF